MMEPRIIERSAVFVVGFVACAQNVRDMDIGGLWEKVERQSGEIKHYKPGVGYELHFDDAAESVNGSLLHYCLTGLEVERLETVPFNMFVKVIPAGQYAVFTHRLGDGGFGNAYQAIETWLEPSEYAMAYPLEVQRYDSRFKGPGDPESVLEYHIPIRVK